jgi:polysaccharide pyruvyl transferase WcaK-like protein
MTRPQANAVAVLGHYGQLNLGDESITAAAIDGARRFRPGVRVIAISLDPADTARVMGLRVTRCAARSHARPRTRQRPSPRKLPRRNQRGCAQLCAAFPC